MDIRDQENRWVSTGVCPRGAQVLYRARTRHTAGELQFRRLGDPLLASPTSLGERPEETDRERSRHRASG
jgi:hypothetical protein